MTATICGVVRLWWALFWVAFEGMGNLRDALVFAQKQRRSRGGTHVKNMRAYHLWEDLDWDLKKLLGDYRDRADEELGAVIVRGRTYRPEKKAT